MRPRLDKDGALIVKTRVFVSKTTEVITQRQIASGFDISIPTLRRYADDEERAKNTELMRRYNAIRDETYTRICSYCGKQTAGHKRCKDCGVLIHAINSYRNGGTLDGKICYSCGDARKRKHNGTL